MRTLFLCLVAVAAHAATTVYQASVDQLTVVHGAGAADSAIHHTAPKSLRVEPGGQYPDALVRSSTHTVMRVSPAAVLNTTAALNRIVARSPMP